MVGIMSLHVLIGVVVESIFTSKQGFFFQPEIKYLKRAHGLESYLIFKLFTY